MLALDRAVNRAPTLSVLVDHVEMQGVLDARIVSNNYYSSDWFEVSFSLDAPSSPGLEFWVSISNPLVEIRCTVRRGQPHTSLILGRADSISVDARRRIVNVSGRDLSGLMVDTSVHRSFPNHSAGEVASLIASYHGLTPRVVPTSDLMGRLYGGTHTLNLDAYYSRSLSDWDLVVRMAVQHGYDAYVEGKNFFFHPAQTGDEESVLIRLTDCLQFRLTRNLVQERQAPARFVSWNLQMQQELLEAGIAGATALTAQAAQVFEPNTSPDRLARIISRMSKIDNAQGLGVQLTMPGETAVTARSQLLLQGIGKLIDGRYRVDCVERAFNASSGYTQQIRARRRQYPTH